MSPACDRCGSHVSATFRRVMSTEDDRLLACPDCAANAHRRGAYNPDYDYVTSPDARDV